MRVLFFAAAFYTAAVLLSFMFGIGVMLMTGTASIAQRLLPAKVRVPSTRTEKRA